MHVKAILPVVNGDVAAVFIVHLLIVHFITSIAVSFPILEITKEKPKKILFTRASNI